MDSLLKWSLRGAATIAGGLFLRKVYTLKDLSENLIIENGMPQFYKFRLGLPPVIIWTVDVLVKNPTRGTLKVKQPLVTLYKTEADAKANKPLISSTVVDKDYTIPKSGEISFDALQLPVGLDTLGMTLAEAYQKRSLELWIVKGTLINNFIPFRTAPEKKSFQLNF